LLERMDLKVQAAMFALDQRQAQPTGGFSAGQGGCLAQLSAGYLIQLLPDCRQILLLIRVGQEIMDEHSLLGSLEMLASSRQRLGTQQVDLHLTGGRQAFK